MRLASFRIPCDDRVEVTRVTPRRSAFAILCAAHLLSGCASIAIPDWFDAGTSVSRVDAGFLPDGAIAPPPPVATCATDADCAAITGAFCDLHVPGGQCTRHCAHDADCGSGVGGICGGDRCRVRCVQGADQCGATQSCVFIDPSNPTVGACFPACYPSDAPPGTQQCAPGLVCDSYQMLGAGCTASPNTQGGRNGAPCTMDTDCGGICLREVNADGSPTGWIGGFCASVGRLPGASAYQTGQPLPVSNCPVGSVAIPPNQMFREGDMAVCLRSCVVDADCGRAGLHCNREIFALGLPPTDGFCQPLDCQSSEYAGMVNHGCPVGYHCQPHSMMPTTGVCARGG